MPFKRTPMRYAHTNGHTFCTYSDNGDLIITCGSDGDMRTWQNIEDDDPTSKCLGEFILCIVHYDKRILVSTDLNTVQAYTFPKGERDGTEFRFTAPANCIRVTKEYIAAGSEDTEIKLIKLDKSESEICFQGHDGPILSIDIDPKNKLLASCAGDGVLKIWDIIKKEELKVFKGLATSKSLVETKCFGTPSFQPVSGASLAYACKKEIIILNTVTWEVQFVLDDENVTGVYSCCQFSTDGKFIAAGTVNGEISIWDVARKETVTGETCSTESQAVTSIVWNPKNNGEFAYCDASGQLGTAIGCFDNEIAEVDEDFLNQDAESIHESDYNGINFQGDDEDVDNDNCVSLEKLKNETMKINGLLDDDRNLDSKSIRSVSVERSYKPVFKAQGPFQPGSTPDNLDNRYLVWNNIGIVRLHSNDMDGSIDVEFHDASTHHALHMNNYLNHTMASLSSTALALAGDSSNKLVCITLAASGSREWSVDLPNCEGILAVVATSKLVAVCTDNRFLRIFSVLGTQREVLSIPGNVVAICGRDDKLMVTFHSAAPSEDQYISALLLQTFGLTIRSKETRIPLTPGKKLTWIGYSDRGSPVCCDTMGLVQMFSVKTNCWYPICDTMKHCQSVSNNFFLIEILESSQIIQAVLCRGALYPPINPRPMVTELPMQIPLCDMEAEKSLLEESLIRLSNFDVDNADKMMKEAAIKLFAIACRSEMEARAKELIEMIASPTLLPLAVKYASKLGRIHLADKLSEMMPEFEALEKGRNQEMRDIETNALHILQNSPLNSSIFMMQNSPTPNTSPQISLKPMVLTNQRRNPFKRTVAAKALSGSPSNILSHLTEKATGFTSKISQISEDGISTLESLDESEKIIIDSDEIPSTTDENLKEKENTNGGLNFIIWFKKNKERLEKTQPDLSAAELTKSAMKEYKLLPGNTKAAPANGQSVKRKIDEEDKTKQTGISKLAKFGFKR